MAVGLTIGAFNNVALRSRERKALARLQEQIAGYLEVMKRHLMTATPTTHAVTHRGGIAGVLAPHAANFTAAAVAMP